MFADYRVPVVLRQLGILEYSPGLAAKVNLLTKCPYCLALLYTCAAEPAALLHIAPDAHVLPKFLSVTFSAKVCDFQYGNALQHCHYRLSQSRR